MFARKSVQYKLQYKQSVQIVLLYDCLDTHILNIWGKRNRLSKTYREKILRDR